MGANFYNEIVQHSEFYVNCAMYKPDTSQKTGREFSGEFSLMVGTTRAVWRMREHWKLFFFCITNKLYKNNNQVLVNLDIVDDDGHPGHIIDLDWTTE